MQIQDKLSNHTKRFLPPPDRCLGKVAVQNFILKVKNISLLMVFVVLQLTATSQINILRYNDNFNSLKSDTVLKIGFQKLKYIPLSNTATVSFIALIEYGNRTIIHLSN